MKGAIALAVLRLALKLDLGPEYDSNASRAELVQGRPINGDTPTPAGLVRTTTRLSLSWQSGISLLRVSGGLGGKVFFNSEVADQNTLVGQLAIDERLALGRSVDLGFSGDYYDSGQLDVAATCAPACNRHRDFRSGSSALRLSFIDETADLTVTVGYRGFQYKPDSHFDFNAIQASAAAALRGHVGRERSHELGATFDFHLERRWFSGSREINACPDPDKPTPSCVATIPDRRLDWYSAGGFELNYLGPVLFTIGYGVQLNVSNSFDFSLLRHVLTARLAGRLPWQIYATVKAQLLFASYLEPQVLGETSSLTCLCLEDENRSALIVDLERPIGKTGVAVEARYSFFTNELTSSPVEFIRHVVYLGVSYNVAWRWGKNRGP